VETDKAQRDADLKSARADLERATTLNRNQAGAWATLSHLYYQLPTTTPTDIELAAQHALEADEFLSNANVILSRLFDASYDLGQFDKAKQWCNVSGQRFPGDVRTVRCRLYMLTTRIEPPDVGRAWRLCDSAAVMVPPAGRARDQLTEHMLVAAVIARASKQQPALADSARHVVQRSLGDATIDPTSDLAYFGAFVYTLLGDKDQAIEQIKRYVAASPNRAASMRDDAGWYFHDIAQDPRFRRAVSAP
jgi:serine/threonine-protein kinase